ncbi:MAG: hypothetical protein ACEPOZ_09990 [Marinifilaceae bacterium]
MIIALLLSTLYVLFWMLFRWGFNNRKTSRIVLLRISLGITFMFMGLVQLSFPFQYTSLLPDFLPYRHEWVTLSGALIVIGGIGILIPRVRKETAIGLLVLLLFLLPLHIQAVIDHTPGLLGKAWEPWCSYSRLLIHPVLMALVWLVNLHPASREKRTHW